MVTEVSFGKAVYSPLDGDSACEFFQFIQSLLVRITARGHQVMADFHQIDCRLKANVLQAHLLLVVCFSRRTHVLAVDLLSGRLQ